MRRVFPDITSASGGLIAAIMLIAACAQEPVEPVELFPPADSRTVWPRPPETPRYAWLGELVGEETMLRARGADGLSLGSVVAWVVGLVTGERRGIELLRPISGATDRQGRIFVVDASHRAVIVFDPLRGRVLKWDQAEAGLGFRTPVACAPDDAGGVYVTDADHAAVYHLDADGEPVETIGRGLLERPTGIARDRARGLLYVADTRRHDIKVFDGQGQLVDVVGGRGTGPGMFNFPTHLAWSGDRLLVSDTLNFRVQQFDPAGDPRRTFGEIGLYLGNMVRPKGVAAGRDGRVYVTESYYDYLLVYDPEGRFLLPIGGTGDEVGRFYLPNGVWTDTVGRVYVADMFNGRIAVFQELTGLDAG